MAIKTKPYNGHRGDGRSVIVTKANEAAVAEWVKDFLVDPDGPTHVDGRPKFKLRTSLGIRVAVLGDTIIRFGNKRKNDITFQVVKFGEK